MIGVSENTKATATDRRFLENFDNLAQINLANYEKHTFVFLEVRICTQLKSSSVLSLKKLKKRCPCTRISVNQWYRRQSEAVAKQRNRKIKYLVAFKRLFGFGFSFIYVVSLFIWKMTRYRMTKNTIRTTTDRPRATEIHLKSSRVSFFLDWLTYP